MIESGTFGKTIRILLSLDSGPTPNALSRQSARRAFLQAAQAARAERTFRKAESGNYSFVRLLRLAAAGTAALALALGGLTGAAYAANDSLPGDFLYSLDLAAEQVSLHLAEGPNQIVQLQLAIAEERLLESEQLAAAGDQANMAVALEAYGSVISELARSVAGGHGQTQGVDVIVSETLLVQEQRLLTIRERVPDQALPNIDRALEAAHQAQEHPLPTVPGQNDGGPGHKPSPSENKHDSKIGKDKPHGRLDEAGNDS